MKSYVADHQTPSQSTIFTRVARALLGTAALLLVFASVLIAQTPSVGFLPSPIQTVSTIPSNGDVNPYGVAFVPSGFPGEY